jgi:hypothetical protein
MERDRSAFASGEMSSRRGHHGKKEREEEDSANRLD